MAKIARDVSGYKVLRNPEHGNNAKKVGAVMFEEIDEFEKHFPDGVFVEPKERKEPKIRFRALSKYCAEYGKDPEDLTDAEREQFIIHE